MPYDRTPFRTMPPVLANLLGVSAVVGASNSPFGSARVATYPGAAVYRPMGAGGMASVYPTWRSVPTSVAALRRVAGAGFDPTRDLVVEGAAPAGAGGSQPAAAVATPRFHWLSDSRARVDVSSGGGMLLVRVPFAPGWHATVDGRSVPVRPADYVDQAIAVPPGHHVVEIAYDDPAVVEGLGISALAIVLLLLGTELADRRARADLTAA